jgi:hypothetical protein
MEQKYSLESYRAFIILEGSNLNFSYKLDTSVYTSYNVPTFKIEFTHSIYYIPDKFEEFMMALTN